MNKIISFLVLIGGLFLVGSFIIILPQIQPSQFSQNANSVSKETPKILTLGIYEVCFDIGDCDPEIGIKKIKAAGANAVIVTVVDEDDLKSVAYYPSKYLPMADYVSDNYLERTIDLAHKNNIKVYASINIPHNYWLATHPDWIAILSNGQPADKYESDYDNRTVPPSRIIAQAESKALLKNIIDEVVDYGVDGIDINDNFQFSDQYLEKTDTMLFSSFDDFTLKKFEKETGITVPGDSVKEKADYLMENQDWLNWRAEQINQLFRILKQAIKDTGRDIPLRPHLLTSEEPYSYYGLDYKGIAKEVDVLYMMITPEQPKEKYFEIIKHGQNIQAKPIAVSTYLFKDIDNPDIERDEEKIAERIRWIKNAGADEIYVYDFRLIEEGNHWLTIKNIFSEL